MTNSLPSTYVCTYISTGHTKSVYAHLLSTIDIVYMRLSEVYCTERVLTRVLIISTG